MNRPMDWFRLLLIIGSAALVLFLFIGHGEKIGNPAMEFFIQDFFVETGAQNAVAGIYLNYRMFDTIFEALMLLVSVMEVINISWSNRKEYVYIEREKDPKDSEIIQRMVGVVYPFVILLGIFVILNGHVSPGGGFQGGTILATALISRYIVYPKFDVNLDLLENLEKLLFLAIVLVPVIYLFMQVQPQNTIISHQLYMITMNSLIGLKVFAGLSIIFYRFVFYENTNPLERGRVDGTN